MMARCTNTKGQLMNRLDFSGEENTHAVKNYLRAEIIIDLEGFFDPYSAHDVAMFEHSFGGVIARKRIVLSRMERKRLFEELFREFCDINRALHG
jgi:hypothetical protein